MENCAPPILVNSYTNTGTQMSSQGSAIKSVISITKSATGAILLMVKEPSTSFTLIKFPKTSNTSMGVGFEDTSTTDVSPELPVASKHRSKIDAPSFTVVPVDILSVNQEKVIIPAVGFPILAVLRFAKLRLADPVYVNTLAS